MYSVGFFWPSLPPPISLLQLVGTAALSSDAKVLWTEWKGSPWGLIFRCLPEGVTIMSGGARVTGNLLFAHYHVREQVPVATI